ncbi:hypothetical protein BCF11_1823 [Collimonas sp. PA-H2]|uniref:hypothetical protein n=1 Tax=Collimonas sp. PA-H2 TaxID=1881062 RepID=UPI000C00E0B7|nr:hypothetical protein [Collimonas sp. PA-H2]PFH09427.1 hypothetical protein BCF11_1823 [Collimonas sp. PA-H2]
MKRGSILQFGLGTALGQFAPRAFSQTDLFNGLNPNIWPGQKRVDYSTAQSPLIEWEEIKDEAVSNSQPDKKKVLGFIDGMATDSVLPVIMPIGLGAQPQPWRGRDETERHVPEFPRSGLHMALDLPVGMLPLPRRAQRSDGSQKRRHEDFHLLELDYGRLIPACLLKLDHREIRLITDRRAYHPDPELWHVYAFQRGISGVDIDHPDSRILRYYARPPVPTCNYGNHSKSVASIEFIMRFDTGPVIPTRFRIELPPMEYSGKLLPMPTVYFEPYNMSTNSWV